MKSSIMTPIDRPFLRNLLKTRENATNAAIVRYPSAMLSI